MKRRRLLKLIVFLLLGTLVNVAVAWGCAIRLKVETESQDEFSCSELTSIKKYRLWLVDRGRRSGAVLYWSYRESQEKEIEPSSPSPIEIVPKWTGLHQAVNDDELREVIGWGWPLVALGAEYEIDLFDSTTHTQWQLRRGLSISASSDQRQDYNNPYPRALPVFPAWPGFAINTIFYAAIVWGVWLLFATPFALRRRRRIKRGQCPACAYPIGSNDNCTECGKPVKPALSVQ